VQSVEIRGLDELNKRFDRLISAAPQLRREFHEQAAELLKDLVDEAINSSGLNDSHGKIKRWQVARIGSGGGYAAVSAEKGETGANSPGAITNYLENGHLIRSPSGSSKRYRPRIKVAFVNGYHFYETAAARAEGEIINLAYDFADSLTGILEGK